MTDCGSLESCSGALPQGAVGVDLPGEKAVGVSVPGLFDHEDAMQAGVVGLLRAIDAYRELMRIEA